MPSESSRIGFTSPNEENGSRFVRYLKGAPKHGQVSDTVFEVLQEAILDGVLPPSSWLREKELAQELSVSRTPIREALRRLAAESLVVIVAHQGAMVVPLTMEDILEVYSVREPLEGLAACQAASHRTQEQLDRIDGVLDVMQRSCLQGSPQELAAINIDFHKAIRKATGNNFLERFLTQIEHAVRRFGNTTYEFPEWATESLEEHSKITEAIRSGDPDLAEKLATDHMRHARRLRIKLFFGE